MTQVKEDLVDFQEKGISIDLIFRGYIEDIENNDIFVHLTDITHEHLASLDEKEDLIASISKDKFPLDSNLTVGTIFYMYLGKKVNTEEHYEIILSRAVWTAEMIAQVHQDAENMYQFLKNPKVS